MKNLFKSNKFKKNLFKYQKLNTKPNFGKFFIRNFQSIKSDVPEFDLLVIGSGPSGKAAAFAAAKIGKNVAIVDNLEKLGGSNIHWGTIPSKTLREAIIHYSQYRQKSFTGDISEREEESINSMKEFTRRVQHVIARQKEVFSSQIYRNKITLIDGRAEFLSPSEIVVTKNSEERKIYKAKNFVLAVGSRPDTHPSIPVNGRNILNTDQLFKLSRFPKNMIVVGGGVVGIEYASMLEKLSGVKVTLIDAHTQILPFVDSEIVDDLIFHMRSWGCRVMLGDSVVSVEEKPNIGKVHVRLNSSRSVFGDCVLYCVGRQGNGDTLNLEAAGVQLGEKNRVKVNQLFQTNVDHIYAVGDLISPATLASSALLQGRTAASNIFNIPYNPTDLKNIPYGIYSIPEIGMVGKTEEELIADNVPYEIGVCRFSELAKGMMQGDQVGGQLKILFHTQTKEILGVHCIGENATELIHLGQIAMCLGMTIDYFTDSVLNVPTLSESYQAASLAGKNKLEFLN